MLTWPIVFVAALALVGPALVVAVFYSTVWRMRGAGPRLERLEIDPAESRWERVNRVRSRVEPLGFEWVDAFELPPMCIGVWRHDDDPATLFRLYLHRERVLYDFTTHYAAPAEVTALVTAGSKVALALPAPADVRIAAFPRASLEELWKKHCAASKFLISRYGLKQQSPAEPVDAVIISAVERHIDHARAQTFWPIRGLWWYFGRRHLIAGRTIEKREAA